MRLYNRVIQNSEVQKKKISITRCTGMVFGGVVQAPGGIDDPESNVHTWRLAAEGFPPGDNNNISGVWYELCLAVKRDLLGGYGGINEVLARIRLTV